MSKISYNIFLIGAKSTGKTVYLTALSLLPNMKVVNEITIKYLKPLREQFEKRDIPATNAGYQELIFEYKSDDLDMRFKIDDYDGKFVEEFSEEENKELKIKVEQNIEKAEGMIFFLPYEEEFLNNINLEKLKKIREEIDLFIEIVRKMHENKKDLPNPVVIAVTKWDLSSHFKKENETQKAIEYLENNEILKNIKEKIEIFFSNTTIIPISSYEKYNLEKPIEYCFYKSLQEWENIIEKLKDDKYRLVCFLKTIKDDIKFYKNGEYLKLYEKLENEVFEEVFKELKNANSLEEFDEILKKFSVKDKNIINCLEKNHQSEILAIKEYLENEKKKKLIKKLAAISLAIIFVIVGYIFYKRVQDKNILYTEITTTYKNGNFENSLELINKYKQNFSKNDKNYKKVIEIENSIYAKCQDELSNKLQEYKNFLEKEANVIKVYEYCNANIPIRDNILKMYEYYQKLIYFINSLSTDNLNPQTASEILTLLSEIEGYKEYDKAKDKLTIKLKEIANSIAQTEDIEKIQEFQEFVAQFPINKEEIAKVNEKYREILANKEYESFMDNLRNLDYKEAYEYIQNNYKDRFRSHISEIKEILKNKLESYIKDILEHTPLQINNEMELNSLKQRIDTIDNLNSQLDIINFQPTLDSDIQNKVDELKNLYEKYNQPPIVTYVAFRADSKKNEPLEFECNDEEEIILTIDIYKYNYKNKTDCIRLTISWNNIHDRYYKGFYNVKVIEKNSWFYSDKKYKASIELTKNDIINLINGKEVDTNIGNGYHIIFRGE